MCPNSLMVVYVDPLGFGRAFGVTYGRRAVAIEQAMAFAWAWVAGFGVEGFRT